MGKKNIVVTDKSVYIGSNPSIRFIDSILIFSIIFLQQHTTASYHELKIFLNYFFPNVTLSMSKMYHCKLSVSCCKKGASPESLFSALGFNQINEFLSN
jgi:hypothetical protein